MGRPKGSRNRVMGGLPEDAGEIVGTQPRSEVTLPRAVAVGVGGEVDIRVPMAEVDPTCYMARSLDVGRLRPRAQVTLRRVTNALVRDGAKTADGRLVTNGPGTVRWLLDQIAANDKT